MTGTASFAEWWHIVRTRGCPYCLADAGKPCWSRFLGREMQHQVHDERRRIT